METLAGRISQNGTDLSDRIFPGTEQNMNELNVDLHYLCDWWDVLEVAKKDSSFTSESIEHVQQFLDNPTDWSKKNGGK